MAVAVAMVPPPIDPQRRWDAARSVLLHLALLLALSLSWLQGNDFRSRPGVWLQFYLENGREPRAVASAPERAAPPPAPVHERRPLLAASDRTTAVGSVHETAVSNAADSAEGTQGSGGRLTASPGEDSQTPGDARAAVIASDPGAAAADLLPAEGAAPVLATLIAGGSEALPGGLAAAKAAEPVAIPASQRAMLARRVAEFARQLRDSDLAAAPRSWRSAGRRYSAVLTRQPAVGDMDVERVTVEVTTVDAGKQLRTQLQMKRVAFSQFTQLIDNWDPEVQLHDDEIAGRFHSNSAITVGYDPGVAPRFLGKVSTAASEVAVGTHSGSRRVGELFHEGLETFAGRISLPERFLAAASDGAAQSAAATTFKTDTRITFYADGSYGWQALDSAAPEERAPVTAYLAAAPKTSLYLHGTVAGSVLVYSPERIVIEGNLVYAHDPRATPGVTDYLALVSDRDVKIARRSVTGPGDLEIDAAVYARRRFEVTDYFLRGGARLYLYGSLTAGTISATEPRYSTRIEYDPRFEQVRPPSFPLTDRYQIERWDPHWQSVDEALSH